MKIIISIIFILLSISILEAQEIKFYTSTLSGSAELMLYEDGGFMMKSLQEPSDLIYIYNPINEIHGKYQIIGDTLELKNENFYQKNYGEEQLYLIKTGKENLIIKYEIIDLGEAKYLYDSRADLALNKEKYSNLISIAKEINKTGKAQVNRSGIWITSKKLVVDKSIKENYPDLIKDYILSKPIDVKIIEKEEKEDNIVKLDKGNKDNLKVDFDLYPKAKEHSCVIKIISLQDHSSKGIINREKCKMMNCEKLNLFSTKDKN